VERVLVENFLVIKQADFQVGKLNVIIGPQASGKSVLAKLLYFFRESLGETFLNSITNLESRPALEKRILSNFERYFPKYTWKDQQ
jgi:AAA15 family ATPase/GTPase